MKKLLLSALAACTILSATAQTSSKPWNLGLFYGTQHYNGDRGINFFNFGQLYSNGGLNVSRYLNKSFDLAIGGTYGQTGYFKDQVASGFRVEGWQGNVNLRYKLIQKEDAKFVPFLFAGLGGGGYTKNIRNANITKLDGNMLGGLGLTYAINDWFNLNYILTGVYTNKDRRDNISSINLAKDRNDGFLFNQIGISFNFGAGADEDKDGVSDKKDKCLGTPLGIAVGKDGCPIDRDGDGILNDVDGCPDVKGLAAFKGCPDTDGDGIEDSKDKCPSVAGIAKFDGCPDTDGDGIEDSKDKCPKVAGIEKFAGCPDTDGDGVQDSEDACPTVKGTIKGCPDGDGDGVSDKDDKCPTVAGIVSNKGCPEVKEEVKKIFAQALQGIQFETGKDVIKKTSYGILDNVAKVMTDNPTYLLDIGGHTDNVGNADKNMTLSDGRAHSVEKYLISKGVAANRLTAKGYGQTMPVADNATKDGKAKNRRVEFKVNF